MQIRYPIKLKSIVKRLSNLFMESRFTISFYKKSGEECKSFAKGKHTARFPFRLLADPRVRVYA